VAHPPMNTVLAAKLILRHRMEVIDLSFKVRDEVVVIGHHSRVAMNVSGVCEGRESGKRIWCDLHAVKFGRVASGS